MTNQDIQHLSKLVPNLPRFETVGVFSSVKEWDGKLFPGAKNLPRWKWDLNKPGKKRFDLLVACNVFMMSSDPEKWFRNVFASCRYFLLQDVVYRKRDALQELGRDGDTMRYKIGNDVPRAERQFDLNAMSDRLLGHFSYFGGANEVSDDAVHFVAIFRGDLADPLIRIDDYPTGVRPILEDMSPLHDIILKVENRGLPYHLAIVPTLIDDAKVGFLRSLKHIIPVMHGYDHGYPQFAPILEEKGDLFNQHGTVGTFDEFKGVPEDAILERLRKGKNKLEDELGTAVSAYTPPCNRADRKTGKALEDAGFTLVLSEKRIPGCNLPWIKSDFYGRSSTFKPESKPDVVTLHTTWEWDVIRNGDEKSLDSLLNQMESRRDAGRVVDQQLAKAIQQAKPTQAQKAALNM